MTNELDSKSECKFPQDDWTFYTRRTFLFTHQILICINRCVSVFNWFLFYFSIEHLLNCSIVCINALNPYWFVLNSIRQFNRNGNEQILCSQFLAGKLYWLAQTVCAHALEMQNQIIYFFGNHKIDYWLKLIVQGFSAWNIGNSSTASDCVRRRTVQNLPFVV